jgi:hypothetical protein
MNKTATITAIAGHKDFTFTGTITGKYTHCRTTFYEFALPDDAPATLRASYRRGFTSVPATRVTFR